MTTTNPPYPRPEVLAPGGNLANVKTAIDFGADAVYAGGKSFGMRTASKNLSLEEFDQAVQYAHARQARIYVTANILPDNDEVEDMNHYLGQLCDIGVDALILTDIGMLAYAHQAFPRLELHISTQAGVTNYQAANTLQMLGASRVVLARELSLEQVRELRRRTSSELEIECFVHGSMCMAFSGRCLISKHLTGRDANHGDCAQSCRWKYRVEEEKRPGQFFPVEVNAHGTFLFNSEDMNMLPYLDLVIDAGVSSLKIEGRAKSGLYVAAMSNAYKAAVNEYLQQRCGVSVPAVTVSGKGAAPVEVARVEAAASSVSTVTVSGTTVDPVEDPLSASKRVQFSPWILEEPYKVTHRRYSTGFWLDEQPVSENVTEAVYINEWMLLGVVTKYDPAQERLYLFSRNKIVPGQAVEFLVPGGPPIPFTMPSEGIRDWNGEAVAQINNPAYDFSFPCPVSVPAGTMIRGRNPRQLKVFG